MMKEPLWACLETPLRTSRENIWKALTLPELTEKYMFNCRLRCNWNLGDPAYWEEVHPNGSTTTHVRGKLIEYAPYDRLRFEIIHNRKELEGFSSELRFLLKNNEYGSLLVIEQGDFSSFPQGQEIYKKCQRGWNFIQNDLKLTCLSIP